MRLRFDRSTCFHRRDTNLNPSRASHAKSANRLDRIDNGVYQEEDWPEQKSARIGALFIEGASIARQIRPLLRWDDGSKTPHAIEEQNLHGRSRR
jgi:hypothetical protein